MKAAGSTPPASASSPPAANGAARPGPTPAASSPPPGRTCRCPQSPRKPSPERRFPPAGSGVSTRKNPTNDSLPQTPMRQSSREPDSIGYTALNKGNVNGYLRTAKLHRLRRDGPEAQNGETEEHASDPGDCQEFRPHHIDSRAAIEDRLREGDEMRRGRGLHRGREPWRHAFERRITARQKD